MSVMQRKLFANKEARTKLRDMGGIMSSFPELSGEVQRFQAGGGVAPEFRPPVPSAYDQLRSESLLPETPELREVDPNATAFMQDVQRLLRQGQTAHALSRIQAGLSMGHYGPAAGLGGRVVGYVSDDPEAAAQRAAGRETMQWLRDPANRRFMLENPDLILQAAEDPISFVARARTQEPPTPEEQEFEDLVREDAEAVAEERAAAGITSAEDSFGARLARGDTEGAEEVLTRVRDAVDRDRAGRIADLLPTPEERPIDETGGGETDTPDIRARAEERIKLFQDLFGSDEPTARDRAMQFAMIGLAIAAGQSPNALTNIASGLLAGTQAMTAQEAERRKERRTLRSSAVTSVLDEMEAERKAASGDDGFQDRESLDDAVTALAKTLASSENYEYEDPDVPFRIAWDLMTRMPGYARYRALPNPYAPAPPSGETGAAVPTDAPGSAFPDDMLESEKQLYVAGG